MITLDIDIVEDELQIQAEAPEGVTIEDHDFDGYTSIDITPPRYSLTVTRPDGGNTQTDSTFLGELVGDLVRELEQDPEATFTIKTSVTK